MRKGLERRQPEPADDLLELDGIGPARLAALEMVLEQRPLEFGQLAVETARGVFPGTVAEAAV